MGTDGRHESSRLVPQDRGLDSFCTADFDDIFEASFKDEVDGPSPKPLACTDRSTWFASRNFQSLPNACWSTYLTVHLSSLVPNCKTSIALPSAFTIVNNQTRHSSVSKYGEKDWVDGCIQDIATTLI